MKLFPRSLSRLQIATCSLVALSTFAMLIACGSEESTYVRGDDVPGIDEPAMSTGLDKKDLEKLLRINVSSLAGSKFYREMITSEQRRSVAIYPIKNETTEHVGPQLQALLSDIETKLVNEGELDVVSYERQQALLSELKLQQSALYDQTRAVEVGKRLGANFFITGKVFDSAERTTDVRRVQYFLFMQAIDVETGVVKWQNKAELTKALIPVE